MARIDDEYFEWLIDLVCRDRFSPQISFNKLLIQLHNTEFEYALIMDENRAWDGINLRYRFAMSQGYHDSVLDHMPPRCSMLEMMVALSIRCEDFMDDPMLGDRTGQWFWAMVTNLGLGPYQDSRYEEEEVSDILTRFIVRDYAPDGRGGLFVIRHCKEDLRYIEIWQQMLWYLNSIM